MNPVIGIGSLLTLVICCETPRYLEEQFEMPPGFRIYRIAESRLTGGSYDIAVDGRGRLLVGDGRQVRRLSDRDGDGLFDEYEVIARGLGGRGPQGLLVHGDRLYAVGGDGIQLFTGYRSPGELRHRGRIGNPFRTGGDHAAHTILRGLDGFLYFITGDGGGTRDRLHITEASSPVLFERAGSVFRISPDGTRWECVGSGGRNAPNLGMNHLGELFSLDSDMEWHVALPWWRPVRLNHWATGGDQGWQSVGAYPPYSIDCLPGILDVGRGSPNWGVFYEHDQLPRRYRDAYLVCDYLWKSATTGRYATSGQLYAFFLERDGARWTATREVLVRPRPGARDASGRSLNFALVDIEVAPDGSLLLSEHNQGIWRIFHDPDGRRSSGGPPPLVPTLTPLPEDPAALVEGVLSLPQPASEWSRLRLESARAALGEDLDERLESVARDRESPPRRRLRALRLLAPGFASMSPEFLKTLAADPLPEVRAQAAWLLGLRGPEAALPVLTELLADGDPFVRRRAAEALTRTSASAVIPHLLRRLDDSSRLVRYVATTALAHHASEAWLERAAADPSPRVRMRALVATRIRRESAPAALVRRVVESLLRESSPENSREDRLDLLRVLGLFRAELESSEPTLERIRAHVLGDFPATDSDVRHEQVRLIGEYRLRGGPGKLIALLEEEKEGVARFHIAGALSRFREGWTADEEERAVRWFLSTQRGWFRELDGKGHQFRQFWVTVLARFAEQHSTALLGHLAGIDPASPLGDVALDLVATSSERAGKTLVALYRAAADGEARLRILRALRGVQSPGLGAFLRDEYLRLTGEVIRGLLLEILATQPREDASLPLLREGLLHDNSRVVRSCAEALIRYRPGLDRALANLLVTRLMERRSLFSSLNRALSSLSGKSPAFGNPRRETPDETTRREGVDFWKAWYEIRFQAEFKPSVETVREKSDREVHEFILSAAARGGDAGKGRQVHDRARCSSCHGGGEEGGRLFGPDLTGVTSRLTASQIADALVYPSKEVADRFRATVIQPAGGAPLTGFITEDDGETVTLVDHERVHRIPRQRILFTAPQSTSLMPERLLNRLSREEIRDLLAYLEEIGARPEEKKKPE